MQTTHRTDARRTGSVVLAALVLSSLAACTPTTEQPSVEPTTVWQSGAPEGSLEDDPRVGTVRASLEAQAIAINRNDFSLPALNATTAYDLRSRLYGASLDQFTSSGSTEVFPGPLPFAPVDVTDGSDDQSASVRGCVADQWASEDGTPPAVTGARGIEYRLQQEDGSMVVRSTVNLPDLDCSTVQLPIALFDPAPEPSDVDDIQQIVRPDRD